MRHTRSIAAAAVLLAACGDPTGLKVETIADLAGTWDVMTWEYSLAYDLSEKNDWVATQDLNGTLYIEANGDFAMLVELPWGFKRDYGTLSLRDGAIYWDGRDDEELVPFEVGDNALTLRWPEEEFVDMDRDGEPEDAWLRIVIRRISAPTRADVAGEYEATRFWVSGGIAPMERDVLAAGGSIELTLNADGTTAGRLFVPELFGGPGFEADLAGTWIFYGTRLELDHPAYTFLREMVFAVEDGQLSADWWDGMMDGYTYYVVLTKQWSVGSLLRGAPRPYS
jgi:hypothetical protein